MKINRRVSILLTLALVIMIYIFNPINVRASESYQNIHIKAHNVDINKRIVDIDVKYQLNTSGKEVVAVVKNYLVLGYKISSISFSTFDNGSLIAFNRSDIISATGNYTVTVGQNFINDNLNNALGSTDFVIADYNGYYSELEYFWDGFKVFDTDEHALNYYKTGALDGLLSSNDDIDDGVFDDDIGYLHNLQKNLLYVGDKDPNGISKEIYTEFTWDDTYEDYTDEYKVELRASVDIGVKNWFGLGKSREYSSPILNVTTDGVYKRLKYVLSDEIMRERFDEYLYNKEGKWYQYSVISFQYVYYLRIYVYDYELGEYRYGRWVRMHYDGSVFDGSLYYEDETGDIDEDGNWVPDSDSDYGDGQSGITGGGSGDNIEDASEDAQKNRKERLDFETSDLGSMTIWLVNQIKNMINALGEFPNFIASIFTFLPPQIIAFIAVSLIAVVVCRFVGR